MSVRVVAIKQSLLILVCLSLSSADPPGGSNKKINTPPPALRVPEIYAPENNSLEAKCEDQVKIFEDSLQKFELWALEMFDASSKIPSGILQGNIKDLGMYDQCLKVNVTVKNETIRGQHCMYTIGGKFNGTKLPVDPVLSVCLPATCSPKQVRKKMQGLIDMAGQFLGGSKLQVKAAICSEVDDPPWELGAKVTLGVFGALVTFLLICTFCDLLSRITNINSSLINTLCKFSFIVNGQRILSTKVPKESLPAITGLKFYSTYWLILGHAYVHAPYGSSVNMIEILDWYPSWRATPVFVSTYSVDTFLVMSGFLTTYLFLKEMARGRKFNIFMYYFHRYIRLTPAFMALLLFTTFLLPKLGSGALWQLIMNTQSKSCKREWLGMLLYVHNYVCADNVTCLGHTWYLAIDMQLFWLSPLILYPLYKKPKLGLTILSAAIVASVITPAVVANVNKFTTMISVDTFINIKMMHNYYILTYTRAGPWFLGVLIGYLLATGRGIPTPGVRKIGWILTILAFAYGFFTYRIYQHLDYKLNIYWETFHAGFGRNIWAFGTCWIVYLSALGHGGYLSRFLSLPIYMPISRLTYMMYLLHFIIQDFRVASIKAPIFFGERQIFSDFFTDMLVTTLSAFFCSLAFESPFIILEKLIFSKKPSIDRSNNGDKDKSRKFRDSHYIKNEIIKDEPEKCFD